MVSRKRFHSFFTGLGLYIGASLLIGYFAVNAYTGERGLRAQQDLDAEYAGLSRQLERLKGERLYWQNRLQLLKSDSMDPDIIDELIRDRLNYLEKRELTLIKPWH
jgi:cell division protein FtsB